MDTKELIDRRLVANNRRECKRLGEDYEMVLKMAQEMACIVPTSERASCWGCFGDVFQMLKIIRSRGPFFDLAQTVAMTGSQIQGVYDLCTSNETDDVDVGADLVVNLVEGLALKLQKAGFGHMLVHDSKVE